MARGRFGWLLVGALAVAAPAWAQTRATIVYNQEYSCNGGDTRLVVLGCAKAYTFMSCQVQMKNAYAPDGNGALIDQHQDTLEAQLAGCTLAGKPAAVHAEETGRPGQALYLGTWYDVTILGRDGGGVRVRFAAGDEQLLDPSMVREAGSGAPPPARAVPAGNAIRPGHYQCAIRGNGGAVYNSPGFPVGAGNKYVGEQGPGGTITVGAGGEITFSGGMLDAQRATYESGSTAVIRLYNAAHTRTVVDCEGPAG